MLPQTIDHVTLVKLSCSGMVTSVHVVGLAGGWGIVIRYGTTESTLAAQRSRQARIFRKLETLVKYLRSIGIPQFDVDSAHFEAIGENAYRRPDTSATLKKAHEAVAYDKWFRAQVQEALDNPQPAISDEEMKTEFSAIHAELAAEAAAKSNQRG